MAGMSDEDRMNTMTMLESPIAGPWGVREEQLDWLKKDVKNLPSDTPVVVFTHSPLWDYYPRWNFQTEDAPEIREILKKFERVMAFHGHVHQTVYNKIGNMSSIGTTVHFLAMALSGCQAGLSMVANEPLRSGSLYRW